MAGPGSEGVGGIKTSPDNGPSKTSEPNSGESDPAASVEKDDSEKVSVEQPSGKATGAASDTQRAASNNLHREQNSESVSSESEYTDDSVEGDKHAEIDR